MTFPRFGLASAVAVAALTLTTADAGAQFYPAYNGGYGAYRATYPTPYGGIVNRAAYSTPYGSNYSSSYYNPYTGASSSTYQYTPQAPYNAGFISPALMPYYGGPAYGGSYVYPLYMNGVRIR